jgi:hypothetical protein
VLLLAGRHLQDTPHLLPLQLHRRRHRAERELNRIGKESETAIVRPPSNKDVYMNVILIILCCVSTVHSTDLGML